jgi:repressor LexA
MKMTDHRRMIFEFIKAYIRLHGVSPSYEVIAKEMGLRSKSNIHRIVHRLRTDGYLEVKPYKFHSIKVVDKSVKEMLSL